MPVRHLPLFSATVSPARLSALLFCLAGLAAAYWQAPLLTAPAFMPPPAVSAPVPAAPYFYRERLPDAAASAHAATLAELPDGRLAAAWFAGSREGAADVAIHFSTRRLPGDMPGEAARWSPPRAIVTRGSLEADVRRMTRKVGNPVLFADGDRLHLFVVSVGLGGWAGSSLNYLHSTDRGEHWSPARKLIASPFFNISTLARMPPVNLADGGLALPAYHEFLGKHGEWLRLDARQRIIDKVRLPQPRAALQPAAVVLAAGAALAVLRDAGPGQGHVLLARSHDAGQHWQAGAALPIRNPNASVALLRLASGRLLLACNPGDGRNKLSLWVSEDQGKAWRETRILEQSNDSGEYSYPTLLQGRDGTIHIVYTWWRQGIRYAAFNESWLLHEPASSPAPDARLPRMPLEGR